MAVPRAFLAVLTSARPEGWVAIGLIIVFFVWSLRAVSQIHRRLERERFAIDEAARRLAELDNHDVTLESVAYVSGNIPEGTVTRSVVELVWKNRRLANPDLNAILGLINGQSDPRLIALRATPNTLLLTGLLGTVLGLGSSIASLVPQIQQALNSTNLEAVKNNLASTLQQMQTAFAATLWGILAALVAGWLIRRLTQRQLSISSAIETLMMELIAPKLLPSSTEAQLDDINAVLRESRDYISKVTEIMQRAAGDFEGVLSRTGETMSTNISELASVSSSMQSSLTTLTGQVERSIDGLNRGAHEIESSTKELQKYHEDMRSAYGRLGDLFAEAREHAERQTNVQMEQAREIQLQFTNASTSIVERVDRVAETLQGTSRSLDEASRQHVGSCRTTST